MSEEEESWTEKFEDTLVTIAFEGEVLTGYGDISKLFEKWLGPWLIERPGLYSNRSIKVRVKCRDGTILFERVKA